ncbi:mismatch-specific DNA-glycosylase [bacterium]|nr:mismatch-specific DNA-glycosylase [bacterium]
MTPRPASTHLVPDLLGPGLSLVFVGTAPSARSAAEASYYAHPGNRFWRALHEAGFTPRCYHPSEYRLLLRHGIGLTDLCKTRAGTDAELAPSDFDPVGLKRRLKALKPAAIAFTSKTAASVWLGRPTGRLTTGRQPSRPPDEPTLFILPSPSGQAVRYWDIAPWIEARRHVDSLPAPSDPRRIQATNSLRTLSKGVRSDG